MIPESTIVFQSCTGIFAGITPLVTLSSLRYLTCPIASQKGNSVQNGNRAPDPFHSTRRVCWFLPLPFAIIFVDKPMQNYPLPPAPLAASKRELSAEKCNAGGATESLSCGFSLAMTDSRPPDPAPENLDPPAPGERRSVRERLELVDLFGEDAVVPPAEEQPAAADNEAKHKPSPKPPKVA